MKLNRFLSISAAGTFCTIGIAVGTFSGWLPALVLSFFGLGPFVLLGCGVAGMIGGFVAYVKLCEYYQFWPVQQPKKNWLAGSIGYLLHGPENKTLYNQLKSAAHNIEKEIQQAYSLGWQNFHIELESPSRETSTPQLTGLTSTSKVERSSPSPVNLLSKLSKR